MRVGADAVEPQDGPGPGLAFGSAVPHLYVGLLLEDDEGPPTPTLRDGPRREGDLSGADGNSQPGTSCGRRPHLTRSKAAAHHSVPASYDNPLHDTHRSLVLPSPPLPSEIQLLVFP